MNWRATNEELDGTRVFKVVNCVFILFIIQVFNQNGFNLRTFVRTFKEFETSVSFLIMEACTSLGCVKPIIFDNFLKV